jgi:3-oxoacid CoA-transferase
LANRAVPGKPLSGFGDAMDLASGAKKPITMTHMNSDGSSKIVPSGVLLLTAQGPVDLMVTGVVCALSNQGH